MNDPLLAAARVAVPGAAVAPVRPAPRREPSPRPPLRVVPPRPRRLARARVAAIVALATMVTIGSLFAIAVVQTLLVQGQAQLDELEREAAAEEARAEQLQFEIARLSSPDRVIAAARARLGMVPPEGVTYVAPDPAVVLEVEARTGVPAEQREPGTP